MRDWLWNAQLSQLRAFGSQVEQMPEFTPVPEAMVEVSRLPLG